MALYVLHGVIMLVFAVFFYLTFKAKKYVIARDYLYRISFMIISLIIPKKTSIAFIGTLFGFSIFTCFGLFILKWLPGLYRYIHRHIDVHSSLYNRDIAAFFMRSGIYALLLGGLLWL